jgi:hypothetical protein
VTAKKASDGLEHGFLDLDKVARHAIDSADITFTCVRRTIIDLLELPRAVNTELMEIKPADVQSTRKIIRGRLLGDAADPAAEGELYPLLEWASSLNAVERKGTRLNSRARIRSRSGPTRPSGSSSTGSRCSAALGKARSPGA